MEQTDLVSSSISNNLNNPSKPLVQKGNVRAINWEKVIIAVIGLFVFGCAAFYVGHKLPVSVGNDSNNNALPSINITTTPIISPTITPIVTSVSYVSQNQALNVLTSLQDGYLFPTSIKGYVSYIPNPSPTQDNPYWVFDIRSTINSETGQINWAVVDASTGKFVCAWTENGHVIQDCIDGKYSLIK
jgi:hypothetical protein